MKRILWTGLALIALMTFVFGISLAENAGGDGVVSMAEIQECMHENAQEIVEKTGTEYEWSSAQTHTVLHVCEYHIECGECGYIGDTQKRITSEEEPHSDPDQDGFCDICGCSIEGQIEWEMAYTRDGRVLHISGNGPIPDYADASGAPWAERIAEETDLRIVIDRGITRIGSHAFGNMNGTVRADFLRSGMPEVDEDAFAGTDAVCRYYADNESWAGGTAGRTDAEWIYLPFYDEEDYTRDLYFNGDWYIMPRSDAGYIDVKVTKAQALEYTHEWRHIHFEALPETPEDLAFVSSWDGVGMLYFEDSCEGEFDIRLSENSIFGSMDYNAPDLTVNIYDPRPNGAEGRILVNSGTVNYHGSIGELLLECTNRGEGHAVVDGNIRQLNFYDATSDRAYTGDLTVKGTIQAGTVYGEQTLAVPGVGDAVSFGGMVKYSFSDVRQQEPVIVDSRLSLSEENQEKLVSSGELTADMFSYGYQFLEGRIYLALYPRDPELAGYSASIEDIYEFNPDFTTDDIIYEPDTNIYVGLQDHTTLVFNGREENGTKIGFNELRMEPACNVVLNCPVSMLAVSHFIWSEGAVELQVNDQVDYCEINISQGQGSSVTLGEKGKILAGRWERPLHENRYFGTVEGSCDLFVNGRLNVLSAKSGQSIQSLLPSDSTVTEAAGQDATVDVNESYVEELTEEETQALDSFMADNGGSVAAVFDVSVTGFVIEEDGRTMHMGAEITELNDPISLTVSNESDGEAYILRLHESPDGTVSADQLCDATDGGTLTFESDLFSKYVIMSAGEPVAIVDSGTCGDNLTWKLDENNVLTISGTGDMTDFGFRDTPWIDYERTIERIKIQEGVTGIGLYAFMSFYELREISLPDSLTRIGPWSLEGCRKLTEITIPANVSEIGDNALTTCVNLTAIHVDPDNAWYADIDGVLYDKEITRLITLPGATAGRYGIPDTVTAIEHHAAGWCQKLTAVDIPAGVTEIGEHAFQLCVELTEIVIPDGVTALGEYTFSNCRKLTYVRLPAGLQSIGRNAFAEDPLTDVDYPGTEERWNRITIAEGNEPLLNATIHFNVLPFTRILSLPKGLTALESEAFANVPWAEAVIIPDSVTSIAEDALDPDIVLILSEDSEWIAWAEDHGYTVFLR